MVPAVCSSFPQMVGSPSLTMNDKNQAETVSDKGDFMNSWGSSTVNCDSWFSNKSGSSSYCSSFANTLPPSSSACSASLLISIEETRTPTVDAQANVGTTPLDCREKMILETRKLCASGGPPLSLEEQKRTKIHEVEVFGQLESQQLPLPWYRVQWNENVAPVGQGSFKVVYDANIVHHSVALPQDKFVIQKASIRLSKDAVLEANLCSSLDHPNLMKTCAWSQDGLHVFALQHKMPGSLMDVAKKVGAWKLMPTEDLLLKYARQILSALEYLHERNYVHCDVKPNNVLLDNNDNAVLSDLGLVHSQTPADRNNHVKYGDNRGTVYFWSPEMLQSVDGAGVSPKSDIWALGITLLYVAVGRLPFQAEVERENSNAKLSPTDVAQTLKTLGGNKPEEFEELNPWQSTCRALISMMLVLDPKTRPSASELLAWLGTGKGRTGLVPLVWKQRDE
eukprot:TRINITY_DN114023_c0_g1_i1.p1 TRINITY_DN114023_c0_g1~~TRINITY_DN114023_c0_g1_i1.p1  ORF type:complete len:451 (-),score=37.12 TRINITY_DN114023_c0_g1_i1:49-1401(-)